MDDEEFHAALVVKDVGILGLALLVLLNAGGLALMVATDGSHTAAAGFVGGLFFGLLAILISYLLAQSAAAGAPAFERLSPRLVLWLQLTPAVASAAVFLRCALRVLETLS